MSRNEVSEIMELIKGTPLNSGETQMDRRLRILGELGTDPNQFDLEWRRHVAELGHEARRKNRDKLTEEKQAKQKKLEELKQRLTGSSLAAPTTVRTPLASMNAIVEHAIVERLDKIIERLDKSIELSKSVDVGLLRLGKSCDQMAIGLGH